MTARTYSLSIKGEQHLYTVEAWQALEFEQLCAVLSDLTGYKAEFLATDLPKRFDRLGYAEQRPAALHEGETPTFKIRSIDGGRPA